MAAEFNEYSGRAGMYRLLAAFPEQGPQYKKVLDQALNDPQLRDIVSHLVGVAFGGYVIKAEGDLSAAIELINSELRTVEDLDSLG
ncbi:hypothetical protein MNAB215_2798 [Mycobacterium numidiamassiliense]|uniref:Uncharacterized protein n=1 Tax=Mycobacterium numidiamassiliense TaxID=1841861 RepID=A0A2U3PA03_9MYCO|nr:hypothetical protein [Mycobacterium numidiamassiliense]SPM40597.1 hypothetical protein MNAB215_2798 [Mycobacterium numidiamassiliense]